LDPEAVVTPSLYVRPCRGGADMTATVTHTVEHLERGPLSRDEIAAQVAAIIPAGSYVNLGIGLPTLVADHLRPEQGVVLHTRTACSAWAAPRWLMRSTRT